MSNLAIIGCGRIGGALGEVAEEVGATVAYWDTDPSRVKNCVSLEQAVASANVILFGVTSWKLREAARTIRRFTNPDATIISVAKGIERETHSTVDQVLTELFPQNPVGVLGGPTMAEVFKDGKKGVGVIGSRNDSAFAEMRKLFHHSRLGLECIHDCRSVSLSGVFKNAYAVALGIASALGWGDNMRAWLFAESLAEMRAIATIFSVDEKIIMGTAGAADLALTVYSPHSRNSATGVSIATGERIANPGEGLISVPIIAEMIGDTSAFPILSACASVLTGKRDAKNAFNSLAATVF